MLLHERCWFLWLLQQFKFLLYVMTDCRLQVAGRPRPWSFICMHLEVSVTLPFRTCTYMKLNNRVFCRTRELSKRNVIALLYCVLVSELHFTYSCGLLLAIDNEWMNECVNKSNKESFPNVRGENKCIMSYISVHSYFIYFVCFAVSGRQIS